MNDAISQKLLSGRYFATVAIITTYCILVIGCLVLVVLTELTVDAFLGTMVGFSGLASLIVNAYFDRKDRKTQETQ